MRHAYFLPLLLWLVGCNHFNIRDEIKVKDYVKARAGYDFDCAKDKVEVDAMAAKTFAASGCGKKGIYECKYPEAAWYMPHDLKCERIKDAG